MKSIVLPANMYSVAPINNGAVKIWINEWLRNEEC